MAQAAAATRAAQREGRSVALCHGCFDIVHPGHLRHLTWAKQQADLLIVSITADAGIEKGVGRPLVTEDLRAENLAALECVDLVVVSQGATAVETLRAVRPDAYVKGAEYRDMHDPRVAAEREVVVGAGGRMLFSSGDVVYSSTKLIGDFADEWRLTRERVAGFAHRHAIDASRARELLRAGAGARCLVVGDSIIDEYLHCDATHVAGEGPMINATLVKRERFMGGAAIVAQHLRALGADVTLATPIGPKADSRALTRVCQLSGIDVLPLKHAGRTPRKRRYIARSAKLFKLDDAPGPAFPAAAADAFVARVGRATMARNWDLVVLLDFGYGALSQGTLFRLASLLRPRCRVMLGDVSGPRADLLALHGCDLLLPTESEIRSAMRAPTDSLAALAGRLAHMNEARGVIVKLGEDGLVAFDAGATDSQGRLVSDFLPSFTERATDPLGCGDALLSAAGLTLAAGGSIFDGAFVGSIAAAMEAETRGNRPIVLEPMLHRLDAEFARIENVRVVRPEERVGAA